MLSLLVACPTFADTRIVRPSNFTLVDTEGSSALYEVVGTTYSSGPVMLLDLHGSRAEQGFAFGRMSGHAAKDNYMALIGSLINTETVAGKAEQAALEFVIDWQWSSVLSVQVPAVMKDELAGFAEGCKAALPRETRFCEHAAGRVILLANLPGDVADVAYVLLDELPPSVVAAAEALLREPIAAFIRRLPWPLAMCSMWAAWGGRTSGGKLLSGRNLDWNENTGINRHKLVTVHHPPEPGLFAHATFGFGGLIGALAGLSAAGRATGPRSVSRNPPRSGRLPAGPVASSAVSGARENAGAPYALGLGLWCEACPGPLPTACLPDPLRSEPRRLTVSRIQYAPCSINNTVQCMSRAG